MNSRVVPKRVEGQKYDCQGCTFANDFRACLLHKESCCDAERERLGQSQVPGQGGRIIFIKEFH